MALDKNRGVPTGFEPAVYAAPAKADAFVRSVLGPFEDMVALERAIADLAEGMRKLSATRLKRDTIILLLHDATKIGKRQIEYVLNALGQLESNYLKPVPSKR